MSNVVAADAAPNRWRIEWVALALCLAIAVYYVGSTVFAVWHYGLTELFADQFRQYARLLSEPFPGNVLLPDNSHRQITSNLLRLADLHWGRGDQDIVVGAGLVMLLLALAALLERILRDSTMAPLQRAIAALLASCALMWMGAARIQFHGNDSFQVYLVMICAIVVIGCVEALRVRPRRGVALLAAMTAAVALLTFGTGVAVSALLVGLLVVRRVEWRWTLVLAAAAVLGVLGYLFLLPGAEGVHTAVSTNWIDIARYSTTFLAGTWTSSWLAFADAGIAGFDASAMQLESLGGSLVASARALFALSGQPHLHTLAFAIGSGGLLLLAWRCWRAWRRPQAVTATAALGIGLALFAVAIAVLVAAGRSALFAQVPGQVLADRYLPWVNLFWLGLGLDLVASHLSGARSRLLAAMAAVLVAAMIYPTHRLGYGWIAAVERLVEWRAAEIQVGVYAREVLVHSDMPDAETLDRAVAVLRAQRMGMFRAERNHLLGSELAALEPITEPARVWVSDAEPVDELTPVALPAWHVTGRLPQRTPRSGIDGLIVIDADGRVVGLGEFSYRTGGGSRERIDDMANAFDLSFRAVPPCAGLRLYAVDDDARRFVPLARLNRCAVAAP